MALMENSVAEGATLPEDILAALDERTRAALAREPSHMRRRRGFPIRRGLVVADVLALLVSFAITELAFWPTGEVGDHVRPWVEFAFFLVLLPAWIAVANLYGLYGRDEKRPAHGTVDDLLGVFHMVSVGLALLVIVGSVTNAVDPSISKVVTFWVLSFALVLSARACTRAVYHRRAAHVRNAIIVGAGDVGQLLAHKILQHPEYGINVVGFVDDAPRELRSDLSHVALLGPPAHVAALVSALDIDRVIIAFNREPHERTLALVRSLSELEVQIDIVPRLFELVGSQVRVHSLEGLPLIGLHHPHLSRSSRTLKRAMDLTGALLGLIALAPVFAYIAMRIRLESEGRVFFKQIRAGTDGHPFLMYKFRTMVVDAEERKSEFAHLNVHTSEGGDPRMFKIPHDPRVTPFGAFLRRYSLDELPQLINVLRGEMSLVGPRPLILEEAAHVSDWARKRLAPKPGITGLWQVLGRSDIPFEEMTKLDYLYVTNWSLWGDLCLLFQTIPAVFRSPRAD